MGILLLYNSVLSSKKSYTLFKYHDLLACMVICIICVSKLGSKNQEAYQLFAVTFANAQTFDHCISNTEKIKELEKEGEDFR